ncbi:hypothetical protein M8494_19465 [Serratia ureilytica]
MVRQTDRAAGGRLCDLADRSDPGLHSGAGLSGRRDYHTVGHHAGGAPDPQAADGRAAREGAKARR